MSRNPAARAGRWSASHWKTATFGWIAFVVLAVALGAAVGTKQLGDDDSPGESGRMSKILDEKFPQPDQETVLVQSRTLTTRSPAFRSAVQDVVSSVAATGVATDVRSPLDPAHRDQVSKDGRSALVTFDIRGDRADAADKIDPIVAAVDRAKAAHPKLSIGAVGDAIAEKQIGEAV